MWSTLLTSNSRYVTSSLRALDHQLQGAVVKPASNSCHHIGHAIDMNIIHQGSFYNSKKLKRANFGHLPEAVRRFLGMVRKDPEIRWGGDFTPEDPVHIDDNLFHRDKVLYAAKHNHRFDNIA